MLERAASGGGPTGFTAPDRPLDPNPNPHQVAGLWVVLNMAIAVLADAYNDQDGEKEEAEKQRCV